MKIAIIYIGLFILVTLNLTGQTKDEKNNRINTAVSENSMFNLQRNAVYNENILAFAYERLLPVTEKSSFALKGGFLIWDPFIPMVEGAFVTGGNKNFFEMGVGALIADTNDDEEQGFDFVTFRIGYRYQAPKGFLLKTSVFHSPDNFILPWISLGYTF